MNNLKLFIYSVLYMFLLGSCSTVEIGIDQPNSTYIEINDSSRFSMLHFQFSVEKIFNVEEQWKNVYQHQIVDGNVVNSFISIPIYGGFADSVVNFTHYRDESGVITHSEGVAFTPIDEQKFRGLATRKHEIENPDYYSFKIPPSYYKTQFDFKVTYSYDLDGKINELSFYQADTLLGIFYYQLGDRGGYEKRWGDRNIYLGEFFHQSSELYDYLHHELDTSKLTFDNQNRLVMIENGYNPTKWFEHFEYSDEYLFTYVDEPNRRYVYENSICNFPHIENGEWKKYYNIELSSFDSLVEYSDSIYHNNQVAVVSKIKIERRFLGIHAWHIPTYHVYAPNDDLLFKKITWGKKIYDDNDIAIDVEDLYLDKYGNELSIEEASKLYKGSNFDRIVEGDLHRL